MFTTKLNLQDILPLTCSRSGTCCHGKQVLLNPWELSRLAYHKKLSPKAFRDQYCELGGIKLRFDGKPGWKGQQACSQYVDDLGCSVHLGRPLSCRLFPLGRQIQSKVITYIFLGSEFPCLDGCPIVLQLPQISVGHYLEGQQTQQFEKVQDSYLALLEEIADIAFVLLLETGLADSGDNPTLAEWRTMGSELPENLASRIPQEWMDCLMLPEIQEDKPEDFILKHKELIQYRAQNHFGMLQTLPELHEACVLIMGVALHLARALGANPQEMAELWIETAKVHGALE